MTDPDLSSASEEGHKRANMNRKRKLTNSVPSSSSSSSSSSIQSRERDPIDLVDLAELFNIAEEHRPKLKSMDQLFKDNPHLSVPVGSKVPNCSAATGKLQSSTSSSVHLHCAIEGCPSCDLPRFHVNATGTSRSSKDEKSLSAALLSPEEITENHKKESQIVELEIYERLKKERLVVPTLFLEDDLSGNLTDEQLRHSLETGQVHFEMHSASLESSLLVQAGVFPLNGRMYHFPECRQGAKCVGTTLKHSIPNLTEPIRLMSMMHEDEYKQFIRNQVVPKNNRPCVLCCRYIATSWVHFSRFLKMNDSADQLLANDKTTSHGLTFTRTIQLYWNMPDREGGYFREYMLFPSNNEPILQPIVCMNLMNLKAVKNKDAGGQWRIDQDAIIWKPNAIQKPRIGEVLQDF